jgi:hypothetical protein
MYRTVLVSLVLLVAAAVSAPLDAYVFPYRKLTADQRLALAQSEQRLQTYDRALQAVEQARREGKISRKEYGYEVHDLTAFISAEARFQNDILISNRPFPPEDVREVMENIVKYGFVMPAEVIGMVALRIAPAFSGISP